MINPYEYWKLGNYIPTYICDEIIKNHTGFGEASVADSYNFSEARKSDIQWIRTPFYVNLVFDIFKRCNHTFQFNITHMESLQLTRYVEPDGKYDFHFDGNGYTRKSVDAHVRKLSMSILLNDPDEFDGGIFQMQTSDTYDIELNKGDLIVFPSYFLHRVTPVTRGTRYSLVAWARGEPLK